MKKILISLIAVVGLLVAGENSAKEVKICEAPKMMIYNNGKATFPNMAEMNCFGYINNQQKLSLESIQTLYKNGWRYSGEYRSTTIHEDMMVRLPGSAEKLETYLIFEKNL